MNIKQSSLIESYSFLFEEDDKSNKQIKIVVDPERNFSNLNNSNKPEDLIAGLITLDIVFTTLQGESQTLLQKAFAGIDRENDSSPFKDLVAGKTLDFRKFKNTGFNVVTKYENAFGNYVDSTSTPKLKMLGAYYTGILNSLSRLGATSIMLEAKQNVIKLSRTKYTLLLNRLMSRPFFPQGKRRTLRVDDIFEFVQEDLQNLLKTTYDGAGEFSANQNYQESSKRQKIALAFIEAVKTLKPSVQKNLGKNKVQICITSILDEKTPLETVFQNLETGIKDLDYYKKNKFPKGMLDSFEKIITGNINLDAESAEEAIAEQLPQLKDSEETSDSDDSTEETSDDVEGEEEAGEEESSEEVSKKETADDASEEDEDKRLTLKYEGVNEPRKRNREDYAKYITTTYAAIALCSKRQNLKTVIEGIENIVSNDFASAVKHLKQWLRVNVHPDTNPDFTQISSIINTIYDFVKDETNPDFKILYEYFRNYSEGGFDYLAFDKQKLIAKIKEIYNKNKDKDEFDFNSVYSSINVGEDDKEEVDASSEETSDDVISKDVISKDVSPEDVSDLTKDSDKKERFNLDKTLKEIADDLRKSGATSQQIAKVKQSVKKDAEALEKIPNLNDFNNLPLINALKETLYKKDSFFNDPSKLFDKNEMEKIKAGNTSAINEFKLRNSQIIQPDTDLILKAIKEIVNQEEAVKVFDSVFLRRKKFNEDQFQKAYTGIIVSAFDKVVKVKEGNRIAEGLLNEGLGNWAKTLGMLAATGAGVWIGGVPGAIILGTLSTMRLVKSLYNARKFEKERAEYEKSPHGYIEKKIFANNSESKKAVEAIIKNRTLDEIIRLVYPAYKKDEPTGTTSGASDYIEKFNKQKETFKSFDVDTKQKLRDLNQKILDSFKDVQYYQQGIVNASVVNSIFNELFLGDKRLNDDIVKKILNDELTKKDIATDIMKPLLAAIDASPVKNRFVQFINAKIRDKSKKIQSDRFKFKRQKTIEKEFIEEIIGSIVSLKNPKLQDLLDKETKDLFSEGVNGKFSLNLLLEENEEQEENDTDGINIDQEKTEQRADDRKHEVLQSLIGLLGTLKIIDTLKVVSHMQTRGVNVTKVANTVTSQVSAYFSSPAAASAAAHTGIDGIHNVVKLADGKIMVGYYTNIASTIGKPEALSAMIVDPSTGTAKMIGHGKSLFSWFAKNKQFVAGVDIDAATGTMSAVKGGTALAINDPATGTAFLTIKNNLLGAVPGIQTAVDSKVEMVSLFSDLQANMDFSGIGSVGDFSKQYFHTFFGRASSYYSDGNLSLIQSTGNDYLDSFAKGFADRLVKAKALAPDAAQAAIDKFTAGSSEILDNLSLQQTYTAAGVDSVDVLSKAQSAAELKFEALWNQTFGQLEIPVETKEKVLRSTIRHLSNPESQAGLNLGLDKVTQTTTTVATKAGSSSELYTPPGPDLTMALSKFASMSALAAAMFNFFRQRGINGGVFGKQFYELFKPQKFVFYDFANMLLGKGPVCQATPLEAQAEQGMKLLSLDPDVDLSQPLENSSGPNLTEFADQPAIPTTNLITQSTQEERGLQRTKKENFEENYICKNSLSRLLFENSNAYNSSKSKRKDNLEKEWLRIWDINK